MAVNRLLVIFGLVAAVLLLARPLVGRFVGARGCCGPGNGYPHPGRAERCVGG